MKSYYTQTEWMKKCRDDDARGKKGDSYLTQTDCAKKQLALDKKANSDKMKLDIEQKVKEPEIPDTPRLTWCEFCNRTSVYAHRRYTDRCIICGNRYAKYVCYVHRQESAYLESREVLLRYIKNEYRQLAIEGCRIPEGVLE